MGSERKTLPDGKDGRPRSGGLPGVLTRIATALVAVAVLVVGAMFSLAIIAIALAVGIVLFGWMWWKLRRAMRQAREDPRFREFADRARGGRPPPRGDIIEGEVIREESPDEKDGRRQ